MKNIYLKIIFRYRSQNAGCYASDVRYGFQPRPNLWLWLHHQQVCNLMHTVGYSIEILALQILLLNEPQFRFVGFDKSLGTDPGEA